MSITLSDKRPNHEVSFDLTKDIALTATGAVHINIPFLVNHVDFFSSSFKLKIKDKVIYIDPLIVPNKEQADYILITHAHQDHFSIVDIKKLVKKETVIICPQKAYKKLSKTFPNHKVNMTKPGGIVEYGNTIIKSIAAYNIKSGLLTAHPKSAMNVGYIIGGEGFSLYHAGDTDYVPEVKKLKGLTVALVPIDGGNLTMSTKKAVEAINYLKPKYAIPMHYNIGSDQVTEFKGSINPDTQVIIMDGQS